MTHTSAKPKITLKARDLSGQRTYAVRDIPADTTVEELVASLIRRMRLPVVDAGGAANSYQAYLERDGRHLRAADSIEEARLVDGDQVTLHPDVQAGRSAVC